MSGFCNSTGILRGPGSVPPRPGRIGCGGVGAPGVCALAAAAVTRPAAAVLRMVRREGPIALLLVDDSKGYDDERPAAMEAGSNTTAPSKLDFGERDRQHDPRAR